MPSPAPHTTYFSSPSPLAVCKDRKIHRPSFCKRPEIFGFLAPKRVPGDPKGRIAIFRPIGRHKRGFRPAVISPADGSGFTEAYQQECAKHTSLGIRRANKLHAKLNGESDHSGSDDSQGKCTAAPASRSSSPVRKWVVDSGSAEHIVCKDVLSGQEQSRVYESNPKVLLTANGEVDASNEVNVDVHQIGLNARAIVLNDTPSVLSLGRLCVEQQCEFHWAGGGQPYLLLPDGNRVDLDVVDFVPQLEVRRTFRHSVWGTHAFTP